MKNIRKRLKSLLWMLGLQFIAGAALATVADFEEGTPPTIWHTGVLAVHVLIALGLLIGSIMLFALAQNLHQKSWHVISVGGMIGVIIALGGGVFTIIGPFNDFFAFLMGVGFITAAALYVKGLVLAQKGGEAAEPLPPTKA